MNYATGLGNGAPAGFDPTKPLPLCGDWSLAERMLRELGYSGPLFAMVASFASDATGGKAPFPSAVSCQVLWDRYRGVMTFPLPRATARALSPSLVSQAYTQLPNTTFVTPPTSQAYAPIIGGGYSTRPLYDAEPQLEPDVSAPSTVGWWDSLTTPEKVGVVAGGALVIGGVVYVLSRKKK